MLMTRIVVAHHTEFEVIAISDDEDEWGEDGGGKMGSGEIEEVHRAGRSNGAVRGAHCPLSCCLW